MLRRLASDKVSQVRRVANFILLAIAYAALFTEPHPSSSYRGALAGGAVAVLIAAILTFNIGLRRRVFARPRSAAGGHRC